MVAMTVNAVLRFPRGRAAMISVVVNRGRRADQLRARVGICSDMTAKVFACTSRSVSHRNANEQQRSQRDARQLQQCLKCVSEPHDNRNRKAYRTKLAAII